jgi:hypothetical protein
MSTRRGFLAGILAAGFAPAAIGSGVLMPVRTIALPELSGRTLLMGAGPSIGDAETQRIINRIKRQLMDNLYIENSAELLKAGEWQEWRYSDGSIRVRAVNPYK